MFDDSGQIFTEGVSLLRELARTPTGHTDARARVAAWRDTYPGLRADLLVYRGPATDRTEYDLLLGMPGDGADTVALSWSPDRGEPWAICYADHWASNYLVTVNNVPTTVQQALLYLRSVLENRPDLMDIIVQHHLLSERVRETSPSVSPLEIQVAADRFRQAHGLLSEAATNQWLTEMRLSMEQFRRLMKENVQRRKFRDALVEERIQCYFDSHPTEFEEVRLFHVQIPDSESAKKLTADARSRATSGVCLSRDFANCKAIPDGQELFNPRLHVSCLPGSRRVS